MYSTLASQNTRITHHLTAVGRCVAEAVNKQLVVIPSLNAHVSFAARWSYIPTYSSFKARCRQRLNRLLSYIVLCLVATSRDLTNMSPCIYFILRENTRRHSDRRDRHKAVISDRFWLLSKNQICPRYTKCDNPTIKGPCTNWHIIAQAQSVLKCSNITKICIPARILKLVSHNGCKQFCVRHTYWKQLYCNVTDVGYCKIH